MKTKLFILGLVAAALMACSSKNEPEKAKQPYVKGQEVTISCVMAAPDDANSNNAARRIYGTASSSAAGIDVPFEWHFDAQETLLIQDLDASENNTSELLMNLKDMGSGNEANFTGNMPDSWEPGHHFIAICRAENDAQEPKREINKTEDNDFVIERGEMKFVSEEYTDIPDQLVMKAAWSAMQICISISTENSSILKKDKLTSYFQLTQLDIYQSDKTTLLYRFKPDYIEGSAVLNSGSGALFLPFFVVKDGNYDNFAFKAYFQNTSNTYKPSGGSSKDVECTFEEIVQDGASSHISQTEDGQYVATFQYSTSLTLLPNQYLKSDVATIPLKPKIVD